MSGSASPSTIRSELPDSLAVLDSLPHPVVMVNEQRHIRYANLAAESFFRSSLAFLTRHDIDHFVPFGSPVLTLVDQVRDEDSPINEYKVDISSPRIGKDKVVDVYASPVAEKPGHVVLMFQPRTMAEKIDRQLTHRGAARTVTGLAAMLAHEIKNPLSGIRGAAQLAGNVGAGRRPPADPPDHGRGRPDREPGRPDGGFLGRAADRARTGQHSQGARACETVVEVRIRAQHQAGGRLRPVAARGRTETVTS